VVADLAEHLPQFAIASLDQHDLVPRIVSRAYLLYARRSRVHLTFSKFSALDYDTLAEALNHLFAGLA
jgi:hypothetical protein